MKRAKRIFILSMILVLLFTMLCACNADITQLKELFDSKNQENNSDNLEDQQMQSLDVSDNGKRKVGNHYVWIESMTDKDGNPVEYLWSSSDDSDQKRLCETDEDETIAPKVVADGEDVFYAVVEESTEKGKVFQTSLKDGESRELVSVDGMRTFEGYFDGKAYFSKSNAESSGHADLYYCDVETQESGCVKENFDVECQEDNYLTGASEVEDMNAPHFSIDLQTGQEYELPDATITIISGDKVYYKQYDEENRESLGVCTITGENAEGLISFEDASIVALDKNAAQVLYDDGELKQYVYENGELDASELDMEPELVGVWENINASCMADVISLNFDGQGRVTCNMPRDEYEGEYTLEKNHISIELTEGRYYSNTEAKWIEAEKVNLKIECTLNYDRMDIIMYDDSMEWKATLSKNIFYYDQYIPILERTNEAYFDEEMGFCGLEYHLYDMNGDGIRELILLTGTCEADYVWNVYTILDGRTVLLANIPGSHSEFCYDEEGILYQVYGHMGYLTINKVSLNKRTLETELVYEGNLDANDEGTALYDSLKNNVLEMYELTDYSPLQPFAH